MAYFFINMIYFEIPQVGPFNHAADMTELMGIGLKEARKERKKK